VLILVRPLSGGTLGKVTIALGPHHQLAHLGVGPALGHQLELAPMP